MVSRAKYRRLTDLYVNGTEFVTKDGSVMWLQVLNQFERDDAIGDAQAARARLTLTLRDSDGDEMMKVRNAFDVAGREGAIEQVIAYGAAERFVKAINAVESDPAWTERLSVIKRGDDLMVDPDEEERQLISKVNLEYSEAVEQFEQDEAELARQELEMLSDDELLDEYVKGYIDRRGNALAMAEYALVEVWYATRCCDAVEAGDGTWDHSACGKHQLKVWEHRADVKDEPDELLNGLADVMKTLNMGVREAKNSHRQGSSSEPSPLPSEVEDSTHSTSTETLVSVPGI